MQVAGLAVTWQDAHPWTSSVPGTAFRVAIWTTDCKLPYTFTREMWFAHKFALIYISNCPMRCNTKQYIFYSASSRYMFRVSTTPIITSIQNCNYSLRYCAATSLQRGQVGQVGHVYSTCFGYQPHPSSGVHKTVTTASCTGHMFFRSYLSVTWPSLATLEGGSCTVPKAVVTVLCTPDDGCGWHPKHVEWTCRIINRLLCVASRWTVITL